MCNNKLVWDVTHLPSSSSTSDGNTGFASVCGKVTCISQEEQRKEHEQLEGRKAQALGLRKMQELQLEELRQSILAERFGPLDFCRLSSSAISAPIVLSASNMARQ